LCASYDAASAPKPVVMSSLLWEQHDNPYKLHWIRVGGKMEPVATIAAVADVAPPLPDFMAPSLEEMESAHAAITPEEDPIS
jgi:hypothetical protein